MIENLILAQIPQLLSIPIIAVDTQRRIVWANKAYLQISGWSEQELKGKDQQLFYALEQSPKALLDPAQSQAATIYQKDGRKIECAANVKTAIHPQEPDMILGSILVFELQLDRQERVSADDFVSTVSHELRTPLTSIKGFAQTLIQADQKLEGKDRRRYLQIIKSQADHLSSLVEDLLFVSRLDNHKIHLAMRKLDLPMYIERVCEGLSNQLSQRNFAYEFLAEEMQVQADSNRLEQVLTNLLGNAIKYSPDPSIIKISISVYAEDEKYLKISVIDQGIGIDQEQQELIFNRFARLDNPLTRKIAGTGLGLYITRSLVLAMNGEIWLEQSDARGSVFSFTLPRG